MSLQLLLVGLRVNAIVKHEGKILFVVLTHFQLEFKGPLKFRVIFRDLEQLVNVQGVEGRCLETANRYTSRSSRNAMVSVKYATTTKIFDRKLCSLIHCCDKLDLAVKNYCHVWITILSIV